VPDPLKSQTKLLPRYDIVNFDQRVLLGVEARITVRKIEKPICAIAASLLLVLCLTIP